VIILISIILRWREKKPQAFLFMIQKKTEAGYFLIYRWRERGCKRWLVRIRKNVYMIKENFLGLLEGGVKILIKKTLAYKNLNIFSKKSCFFW
jgi:hypothetical protein